MSVTKQKRDMADKSPLQNLIAAIRTKLSRAGITGVPQDIIKTAIASILKVDIDSLTPGTDLDKDQRDMVFNLIVAESTTPEDTTDEKQPEDTTDEKQPETKLSLSFGDSPTPPESETSQMIKSEAQKQGVNLSTADVTAIEDTVKSNEDFRGSKLQLIKSSVIEYIDYHYNRDRQGITDLMGEVKQHADNRAAQLNNGLAEELNNFFRSEQNTFDAGIAGILQSINAYRE